MKHVKLSKRKIAERNERLNGATNAASLAFMAWIKTATIEDLDRRRNATPYDWQRIAIDRELERRKNGST